MPSILGMPPCLAALSVFQRCQLIEVFFLSQLMGTMKQRPTPEPVDTTVPKAAKKPKAQKKKKKRDPNEPQK